MPVLQDSIGFGLFYIFAACCIIMAVFVIYFVPETKGISIDNIARLEPWLFLRRRIESMKHKAGLQERLT